MRCNSSRDFRKGDRVTSLAYYPPAFTIGLQGVIGSPYYGPLYAVKLPNGELYRWFAGFELDPIIPDRLLFRPGDMVIFTQNDGHPPSIVIGTRVQIVKVADEVSFYDLYLAEGIYHRWVTWFDIVRL